MKKTKITFIILQYRIFEETVECIHSIQKSFKKKNHQIVIVDNGSENGADEKMKRNFIDDNHIHVLYLKKNEGFSKANNQACKYAKEQFDPNFYCIINNDTLITQKNWTKLIEREYKNSKFDVLGPDIINLEGKHSNPLHLNPSKKRITRLIFENELRHFFNKIYLGNLFENVLTILKNKVSKNKSIQNEYLFRKENIALHGSALIFSKKFFDKMQKPFFPEVFLYGEEEILNYNRILKKLKFVYSPEIKILHKEDKTSDLISKSSRKRNLFKAKNSISSFKVLLKYVKKNPLT